MEEHFPQLRFTLGQTIRLTDLSVFFTTPPAVGGLISRKRLVYSIYGSWFVFCLSCLT